MTIAKRRGLIASLRSRVLILTALAFAVVSVPAYFAFVGVVNSTVIKLGTLFAEKQILFDRYRGLGALMQEVKLAETLAGSRAIRDWAADEADPDKKDRGIAELEHYRQTFADHSYFFVVDGSGDYYFNDAQNGYAGRQLSHTLNPANPRDAWYYKTRELGTGCHLNVDHDDVLAVTKVWINCVIRDGDKVLGVLGSGLDLSAFIKEVVDVPQTGVTTMFVDRAGAVQAYRDRSLVDFHSITKDLAAKKTVYSLIDEPEDRASMGDILAEVTTSSVEVRSRFMHVGGRETLVGVGYLDKLGWYNVTFMDVDKIIDRSLFLPIGLVLGAMMALFTVLAGLIFKRAVLDRLERVEARFAALRRGGFSPTPVDHRDDEIGRMAQAFDHMATAVDDDRVRLEQMVSERTEQLRALAYRDQMTGIANRRGFIEEFERIRGVATGPLALLLIDIDAFKSINDTHGHVAGDTVVTVVARRLEALMRPGEVCGRWGGDEFVLLLPEVSAAGLQAVADAFRDGLTSRAVPFGVEHSAVLTVSIGATLFSPDDPVGTATELADAALYRAKSEGRNRAVVFDAAWGERGLRRA